MDMEPPRTEPEPSRRPVGIFLMGFLGLCVPSLALTALGFISFGFRSVKQPVEFNHKKHVADVGLTCDTCHSGYEKEIFSGLPKAEDCAGCHSEAQGTSEKEKALVALLKRGEPLEWKRLFAQPSHVFFSHRRHFKVAKLACATCHGTIAETAAPPGRVSKLLMGDCINCHKKSNVSVACTTCHR